MQETNINQIYHRKPIELPADVNTLNDFIDIHHSENDYFQLQKEQKHISLGNNYEIINGDKYQKLAAGLRKMKPEEKSKGTNPYDNGKEESVIHRVIYDTKKNQKYIIFQGKIYKEDATDGNLYNAKFEELKPILERFKESYKEKYSFSETEFEMLKLINNIFPENQQVFFDVGEEDVYTNYQENIDEYNKRDGVVFWNSNSDHYPLQCFKDGDKDCINTTDDYFIYTVKNPWIGYIKAIDSITFDKELKELAISYKLLLKLKTDIKAALTNAGYDVSTDEKLKPLLEYSKNNETKEIIKEYYTVHKKQEQEALSERYMQQTFKRFDKNEKTLKQTYDEATAPEEKDTYGNTKYRDGSEYVDQNDTYEQFRKKWSEGEIQGSQSFVQTPKNKMKYETFKDDQKWQAIQREFEEKLKEDPTTRFKETHKPVLMQDAQTQVDKRELEPRKMNSDASPAPAAETELELRKMNPDVSLASVAETQCCKTQ